MSGSPVASLSNRPSSPQLLPLCFPLPRVTNGANYFLQFLSHELSSGEFPRDHACTCACLLLSTRERDRQRAETGESFQGELASSSKFPHAQLPVLSVCGRPLSWAGCPLSISQSLWLIACLSGHVCNSVEAVLNNNTIILAMGEGRHRNELFVPRIPLQHPAKCTLCLV